MMQKPGGTVLVTRPARDTENGGLRPPGHSGHSRFDQTVIRKIRSPITWIGGKGKFLKHILPYIEPRPDETHYIEPFGGSGVVLLNKSPHPCETYNDTDSDLVNLFQVLRDPDRVVHLWWELLNTPYAREEFREAIASTKHAAEDPVIRAAQFVIRCRMRFGGGIPGKARSDTDRSWGISHRCNRGMNDIVSKWLSTMLELPRVHRRLATVVIDHQDAARCVKQWDGPSTLFYVDPPYVGTENYYQGGFKLEDHGRLAEALNAAAGRVVLSYYPHPILRQLYPSTRWHWRRVATISSACGNAPWKPGDPPTHARECQRRTELIISNFTPGSRRRLGHSMGRKSA